MKRTLKAILASMVAGVLMFPIAAGVSAPVAQADPPGLVIQDMTMHSPEDLVAALMGAGGTGVTYSGAQLASGIFSGAETVFGEPAFSYGIILSNGDANRAAGPNTSDGQSRTNWLPGDAGLTALIGAGTNDASVLEFDYVPTGDILRFRLIFGSDEYNEGASYWADVFGLWVNGVNIATTPSGAPVAVTTLNGAITPALFVNNDPSDLSPVPYNVGMDGFSRVMDVQAAVTAGLPTHIKLAIADYVDWSVDSWVLVSRMDTTPPAFPVGAALAVETVCTDVHLSWPAATDDFGAVQYRVLVDGVVQLTTTETQAVISLPPGEYTFEVQAGDYSGNWGVPGLSATASSVPPTGIPHITMIAPHDTAAVITDGDEYLIQFMWGECGRSVENQTVIVRIRDAATNALIAGYAWHNQIQLDPAGIYSQLFKSADYPAVHPGQTLKVMVYFDTKLQATRFIQVE